MIAEKETLKQYPYRASFKAHSGIQADAARHLTER